LLQTTLFCLKERDSCLTINIKLLERLLELIISNLIVLRISSFFVLKCLQNSSSFKLTTKIYIVKSVKLD